MPEQQQFRVFLSFKDEATGKFIKATEEQINAIKKLGVAVKKEGAGVGINMDKMGKDSEKAGRSFRFLGGDITGVMKSLGSLRNMLLVYFFALRPVIQIVKESIEAFTKQEDAIKRINYAMGLQGTYSKRMSDDLIKLSQSFQSVTRYGDEAVLEVMEKLITIGYVMPSQLERVTQATLDFASATGKDLATATEIMSKAAAGYTGQLSRYGIVINQNLSVTEKFNEVLKYIETRMGKRAQADVESYAGRFIQMSNAVSDLKESIGRLILEGLKLDVVAEEYKKLFNAINRAITQEGVTTLNVLEKHLAEINKKISSQRIEFIAKQKPSWFRPKEEIESAKQALIERESIIRAIESEKQFEASRKRLADIKATEAKELQIKLKAQEDFMKIYDTLPSRRLSVEKAALQEDYKLFIKSVDDKLAVQKWYSEESTRINKEVADLNKRLYDEMTIFARAAAVGMRDALTEGFFKIVKGEFESLSDVVSSFVDMIIKTIIQISVTSSMISTFPWTKPFLVGGAHTGGYMYGKGITYGMPQRKFHSGGEVPATLLEGEYVLNRRATRNIGIDNLDRLNRGETTSRTTINNYYIQTIDERSFTERLRQHPDIFAEGAEMGIRDNRSLRSASQRFG